jgi:hypothetical protein
MIPKPLRSVSSERKQNQRKKKKKRKKKKSEVGPAQQIADIMCG